MSSEPDEALAKAFEALIGDRSTKEGALQAFFETHTEFIPTPYLLGHKVHMNCIISKFPVGGRTADFAYLTKDSDSWHLVLIEIETASKRLFVDSSKHVGRSARFNDALAQTDVWREYWDDHQSVVREVLQPLLTRSLIARNRMSLRRVLIIGRSAETEHNAARRARLATIAEDQALKVMTYDGVLRRYRHGPNQKRCMLSPRSPGFAIKALDGMPEHLFSDVGPEHLEVSRKMADLLKADGYHVAAWRKGELLTFNGRWVHSPADDEAAVHEAVRAAIDAAVKKTAKRRKA